MAAYIIVFYGEKVAPEWETRLYMYTVETKKSKNIDWRKIIWLYVGTAIACSLVFCHTRSHYINNLEIKGMADLDYIDQFITYEYSCCIILLLFICIIAYLYNARLNYQEEKDKCIEYWKKVKSQEDIMK